MKALKTATTKQNFVIILGILLMFGGLVLTIFGLIGEYGPRNNPFYYGNSALSNAIKLNLVWLGVLFLLLGSLLFALGLSSVAKGEEREKEKEARRKQRLGVIDEDVIVDVETNESTIDNTK